MKHLLALLSLTFVLVAAEPPKGEPTNAKEAAAQAAAKKAAQDKVVDERYQVWFAKLSAAEQAWEKVLQQQLGSFYLPLHKRDKIAGKSNAWDFVQDDPKLPRILLIGDSVSRGYTQPTRKALAGKANVHRAPANCGPTASGLKNLDVWLGEGKWDVIHFNFGIHDRATPAADYVKRLEEIVVRLEKTGAKLMWASTTPIPDNPAQKQTAASIVEKNALAAEVMKKHGIPTDDLFGAMTPRLKEFQPPRDVHFTGAGYDFLGATVGEAILGRLK
ncbi:MAG: SGNH/GDSL hydrolase family protein [Opitutia bacterium AMD-G1]|nr:MAG: SGNH/GDSL hydrolase family protein [Opitutae bacterium AMD-G1]